MNEETFLKKCPGCGKDLFLNKKTFDAFKQVSEDLFNAILNSQYCSGECARKYLSKNDKIFRSKNE